MAVVITERSEVGIVMVADSALNQRIRLPSGIIRKRFLFGVKKLHEVPYLKAGISTWGRTTLKNDIPIDVWLQEFIRNRVDIMSLEKFANELTAELQGLCGTPTEDK